MLASGVFVSVSRLLEKILSFLLLVYAGRAMGVEALGEFFFFFSLVSLAIPLMDAGFEKLYLINSSKEQESSKLLTELLFTKLLMGACTLLLLLVSGFVLNQPNTLAGVSACFVAIFSNEIGQLLRSPDRLFGRNHLEVLLPPLSRLLTFLLFIWYEQEIKAGYQLAFCYAAANLFTAGLSAFGLAQTRLQWRAIPSLGLTWHWMREGLPFSLTHLFVMVNLYADSVILGQFSLAELGWYSVAYRIVLVLGTLSAGALHVLFPQLRSLKERGLDSDRLELMRDVARAFLILFGGLAIGSGLLGARWIPLLYGAEFGPSLWLFQLLSPLILIAAFTNLIGQSLEAMEQQAWVWRVNLGAACFNVASNLIAIPLFGAAGAALTTVMTETSVLVLFLVQAGHLLFAGTGWYAHRIAMHWLATTLVTSLSARYLPLPLASFSSLLLIGALTLGFIHYWLPAWSVNFRKDRATCVS